MLTRSPRCQIDLLIVFCLSGCLSGLGLDFGFRSKVTRVGGLPIGREAGPGTAELLGWLAGVLKVRFGALSPSPAEGIPQVICAPCLM